MFTFALTNLLSLTLSALCHRLYDGVPGVTSGEITDLYSLLYAREEEEEEEQEEKEEEEEEQEEESVWERVGVGVSKPFLNLNVMFYVAARSLGFAVASVRGQRSPRSS